VASDLSHFNLRPGLVLECTAIPASICPGDRLAQAANKALVIWKNCLPATDRISEALFFLGRRDERGRIHSTAFRSGFKGWSISYQLHRLWFCYNLIVFQDGQVSLGTERYICFFYFDQEFSPQHPGYNRHDGILFTTILDYHKCIRCPFFPRLSFPYIYHDPGPVRSLPIYRRRLLHTFVAACYSSNRWNRRSISPGLIHLNISDLLEYWQETQFSLTQ